MALLCLDGFDKYGPTNANGSSPGTLLTAGEWNTATNCTIVAALSSTGYAVNVAGIGSLSKTLSTNYGRLIGGARISPTTLAANSGIQFVDASTNQCGITINSTTGTFSVRTGSYSTGTVLGTSTTSVTANSVHYLEWDITFATSGSYQLWLDGVSILSGSGNTHSSANNYANVIQFNAPTSGNLTVDDFYLLDTTGSVNNAVLNTSPRVETSFASSDSAVQFSVGAATLGSSIARNSTNYNTVANTLYVRPYMPTRNCTLTGISYLAAVTSSTINVRPVVYADNGGTPNGGTLLQSGSTVVGNTSGSLISLPLTSTLSLTAGVQYWLGFMNDIAVTGGIAGADSLAQGRSATSTFSSGAPGTCPTLTTGIATAVVYGNVTSTGANYYELTQPPQGLQSYLTDTTVSDEDIYNFGALVSSPTTIHAVAMKANCARSDSGARTVSIRMKSSGTDGGGSSTGQTPGTSFGWLTSYFITDPNTGSAWLPVNLNAALCGFKIDA